MSQPGRDDGPRGWAPLRGVSVLDITRWVAGPYAAKLLGDLGASVTRIEPDGGDPLLELDHGPTSAGRCAYDYVNAGKHLERHPDVGEALRERLVAADVLLCDRTPAEQTAAGYELGELRAAEPALVVGSVTGYGLTGPSADRPWSELTIAHAGTEAAVLPGPRIFERFPDRPPVRAGRLLAGFDTGLCVAGAVVAALVRRAATGIGDLVEVAAQEVQLGQNRTTISRGVNEGRDYDRTYEGYGWQGTLRTRDGWVCLRPNEDRHWRAFTAVIGRPELADDPRFATYDARFANGRELMDELERWSRGVDRVTVRAAMLEAGVPGAPYLEPHEVLADPAVLSREVFEPWPGGGRAPRPALRRRATSPTDAIMRQALLERLRAASSDAGPLAGVRILDLTWVASGPHATLLLGSLGADVVKVECRDRPDLFRRTHGSDADLDEGLRFVDLNQGKRSVEADLSTEEGRESVRRLAASCDVLVENYRPGVRERLGLGDATLVARNPLLAIVSLSGFGVTASDASRPGYASVFSAESGISAMTGYPDAPPTDVRDSNDLRGGTAAFLAVVAALRGILTGQDGSSIDLAIRDVLIGLQGDVLLQASRGGDVTRSSNALEGCPEHGCYLTADDRWVAISARTLDERRALAAAMSLDAAASDPVPSGPIPPEPTHRDDAALAAWVRGHGAADVIARLTRARVPAATTTSVAEVARDPHLRARGVLRRGSHPRLGELWFVAGPIRSHTARRSERAAPSPLLGQHTADVWSEMVDAPPSGPGPTTGTPHVGT